MANKHYEVGETFQLGFFKLKAEIPEKGAIPCRHCFMSELTSDCRVFKQVIGECSSKKREDKTDVIFVEVEGNNAIDLSFKRLRKEYDNFCRCWKGMNGSLKKYNMALTEICEMYKGASEYAKTNGKGDFGLSTRLENAYTQGWGDCKKFHETNKED